MKEIKIVRIGEDQYRVEEDGHVLCPSASLAVVAECINRPAAGKYDALKEEIKKLKSHVLHNFDFSNGYLAALSAVEGMIAILEEAEDAGIEG